MIRQVFILPVLKEKMSKILINNLSDEELYRELSKMNLPAFRIRQIKGWLYKCVSFDEMRNLPKELIGRLDEKFQIDMISIYKKLESDIDSTKKYLFKLYDDEIIESVAMEYKHGMSICVSTQVGCAMGCVFCASALGGMKRNLSAYEMLAQVIKINNDTGKKAGNVVLMGAGEPMLNYNNVIKFMKLLHKEDGLNISYRSISLSTCGITEGMYKLANENMPINLCISLHSIDDDKRGQIMPSASKYKIFDIMKAAEHYFNATGRRITIEYALIEGVNDSADDINALVKLLSGMNILVNLIPLNSYPNGKLNGVSQKSAYKIMENMKTKGINTTLRRTMGADIEGACGQLRARELAK